MSARINLGDLKSQIGKRVGPDRAQQYFGYLNQLLSRKLSKAEFNKLCALTLGRENLHLHNQLVRAVFKNAIQAKTPPLRTVWSMGDVLPHSPRRVRRIKDRVNGRAHLPPNEEFAQENDVMKRPRLDLSSAKLVPIQAPLGIPFCAPSIGGSTRGSVQAGRNLGSFGSCSDIGELLHTEVLRKRIEIIAAGQGLEGAALDCSNLLNIGLNAYLKRLIKASVELVGTSSGNGQTKQQAYKHQINGKPINGVHLKNGDLPLDIHQTELLKHRSITMQDFRVAMELNPCQLGENWPLLLEKISHDSFKE